MVKKLVSRAIYVISLNLTSSHKYVVEQAGKYHVVLLLWLMIVVNVNVVHFIRLTFYCLVRDIMFQMIFLLLLHCNQPIKPILTECSLSA